VVNKDKEGLRVVGKPPSLRRSGSTPEMPFFFPYTGFAGRYFAGQYSRKVGVLNDP